jgi:hypothetical protein
MKKVRKWMRIYHRDLGYLLVGIILIYAISGLLLNHYSAQELEYSDHYYSHTIDKNLSISDLEKKITDLHPDLNIKKIRAKNTNYAIYIANGSGTYKVTNGDLKIKTFTRNTFMFYINKLHMNSLKYWTYIADFFAIALIFFAISGLVIVKGKNGFLKRGIYLMIIGILIPIIICLVN